MSEIPHLEAVIGIAGVGVASAFAIAIARGDDANERQGCVVLTLFSLVIIALALAPEFLSSAFGWPRETVSAWAGVAAGITLFLTAWMIVRRPGHRFAVLYYPGLALAWLGGLASVVSGTLSWPVSRASALTLGVYLLVLICLMQLLAHVLRLLGLHRSGA